MTKPPGPEAATLTVPRYLSVADLQDLLSISRTNAYALIHEPDFPGPLVLGRLYRYPADEVLAWIESHRGSPTRRGSKPAPSSKRSRGAARTPMPDGPPIRFRSA